MHPLLFVFLLFVFSRATADGKLFSSLNVALDNSVTDYLKILSDLFVFNPGTFLKSYGYPFENYEVTTEDGYILALHRIPYGRSESSKTEGKPVVLLMHGLGSSSADYFILGPERSLPLLLADSGYDVWLGNNRGSTWSQKHISLDPAENKTFWDFSFHELGVYDLPVIIDHVLNTTGVNTVSYVGHSQGSTQFFAMAAAKPEYNDKINLMVALAPVAYVEHIGEEVVQFLKNFFLVVDYVTNALNITYVLPHSPLASMALSLVCSDRSSLQSICVSVYNSLGGESTQLNKTTLSIMVQTFPGGSAIKERKHYLQEVKSARFRQYDYGIVENNERYGQTEPPDYDVSKITVPVALYPGEKDIIAVVTDVDRLAQELPNLIRKQLVDDCSHLDFIMGRNSSVLYAELRDLINDYNGLSKSYVNIACPYLFIVSLILPLIST